MNTLFDFHKQLNYKKIIIAIIISLFLITISIEIISNICKKSEEKKIEDTSPNKTFYSNDNTISLEISKKYEFTEFTPSNNYLLELRSPKDLNIFISFKNTLQNRPLLEIISADKRSFIEGFNGYSNLSEPKDISINETNPMYTYSFHYLDNKLKKTFYLQIIWIQTQTGYYIIDTEFPLDDLNIYSNIITDILAGFKFNNQN